MSILEMEKRDILPLYLQILLVSHQHYWHLGGSTHHVHNLIIKYLDDLEAPEAVYGVDQDVAVDVHCVLGGEHAVLVLARCVHQEELEVLVPDLDRLGERVLYRRIVRVHKLSLDKLNGQGTFAH